MLQESPCTKKMSFNYCKTSVPLIKWKSVSKKLWTFFPPASFPYACSFTNTCFLKMFSGISGTIHPLCQVYLGVNFWQRFAGWYPGLDEGAWYLWNCRAGILGCGEPGISGSLVSLGSWALGAWQPWGCRAGCRNKGFLNYYLIWLSRSYCLLYILLIYFKVPVYVIMNYLIGASSPSSLSLHWALTGAHCIFLKYSPKFLSKLKAKWKLQKREWETKLKCFLHFVGTKIWCCSDQ